MDIKELITRNLRYYKIPTENITDDMVERSTYSSVIYIKKTANDAYGCLSFETENIPLSALSYTTMTRTEWEVEVATGWQE